MILAKCRFRWTAIGHRPRWTLPPQAEGALDVIRTRGEMGTRGLTEGELGGFAIMMFPDGATLPPEAVVLTRQDCRALLPPEMLDTARIGAAPIGRSV